MNLVLKKANYMCYIDDYYVIPVNTWSSSFLKNFNSYANQQLRTKADEILQTQDPTDTLKSEDIKRLLLEHNWIYRTHHSGAFIYDEKYCALENALRTLYKDIVAPEAKKFRFASIIPMSELERYNYPESTLSDLYLVTTCDEMLEDLKIRSFLEGKVDLVALKERTKALSLTLNYNACSGLWPALENRHLDKDLECYLDTEVYTFRNEKNRANSLERLQVFNRFQIVYVGTKSKTYEFFDILRSRIKEFFNVLKIPYTIKHVGTWFNQNLILEGAKTFDFEVLVDNKPLEIGNISYNGDHYTKIFNVKTSTENAYSGCSGIGTQRLIYTFLSIHKLDPINWPLSIRDLYIKNLNNKYQARN
jgi:seryl-tRNA synthetase